MFIIGWKTVVVWFYVSYQVIDKSFGFDYAVEAEQANKLKMQYEAESFENCIGVFKLMGRYSGEFQFSILVFQVL